MVELSAEWTSPSGCVGSGMEMNRICEGFFNGQSTIFPSKFHSFLTYSIPLLSICKYKKKYATCQDFKVTLKNTTVFAQK